MKYFLSVDMLIGVAQNSPSPQHGSVEFIFAYLVLRSV